MGILENVAIQWLIRRIPEWSGLIVTLVTFYGSIPPHYQSVIIEIVSGRGGGLTIGAVIGFAMWAYAQFISFRSTTKPKTVSEVGGKPVEIGAGRKSLFDILKGK